MINFWNGYEEKMILLEGGDFVQIVVENVKEEILFICQYCFGLQDYIYELLGGLIDKGEELEEVVRCEFREEMGFVVVQWWGIGLNFFNLVFMEVYIYYFVVSGIMEVGGLVLDVGEDICWELMLCIKVKQMLFGGCFLYLYIVCGLLVYFVEEFVQLDCFF